MSRSTKSCFLALLVMTAAACTVKGVEPPALTGPSGPALRIVLQAVPDSILLDGSQTAVTIDVTGADGRPVRGLPLTVAIAAGGAIFDFGSVSAKTVVTGDDGRARVIYTALRISRDTPVPADQLDPSCGCIVVTLIVTPIGTDFRGENPRTIDIRLIPPGVITPPTPPNDPPVAILAVTPTSPTVLETVSFDASASTDDIGPPLEGGGRQQVRCGANCTYAWEFGDGATATGIVTTHQYRTAGNFQVRLTVTDAGGLSAIAARTVVVGVGTAPTASFTVSPSAPAVDQAVFFTAEASRAAPGRTIVSYDWNFGNGRRGSGVTTTTSYSTTGSFTVTLTVTDDAGQQATATSTVTVSAAGALTAALTVSPTSGTTGTNFFFDASASRPGPSPIVEYRFTFGDASPDVVGSSPTTTHRYATPGGYTARVTIRDSAGRVATATVTVTVQ